MTICHNLLDNFFFTSSRHLPCILSYAHMGYCRHEFMAERKVLECLAIFFAIFLVRCCAELGKIVRRSKEIGNKWGSVRKHSCTVFQGQT